MFRSLVAAEDINETNYYEIKSFRSFIRVSRVGITDFRNGYMTELGAYQDFTLQMKISIITKLGASGIS